MTAVLRMLLPLAAAGFLLPGSAQLRAEADWIPQPYYSRYQQAKKAADARREAAKKAAERARKAAERRREARKRAHRR